MLRTAKEKLASTDAKLINRKPHNFCYMDASENVIFTASLK